MTQSRSGLVRVGTARIPSARMSAYRHNYSFHPCPKLDRQSLRPASSLTRMGEHIPKARLLAVAVDDELIFTLEEFNHLKACRECFVVWTEFICQSQLRDEEKKKTNQAIGIVL